MASDSHQIIKEKISKGGPSSDVLPSGKEAEAHEKSSESAEALEVQQRQSQSGKIVYKAICHEGSDELERPPSALAWSGLAAGLSMGFSMASEGLLRSHLPNTDWAVLISKLGYSVGFLVVILGRQQLFTENTLTVILPLASRRDVKKKDCGGWLGYGRNILGGVPLVALINHAQVVSGGGGDDQ